MNLANWLSATQTSLSEFAAMGNWPLPTVHGWVKKRRVPRLKDAVKIEDLTEGKVLPRSFVTP